MVRLPRWPLHRGVHAVEPRGTGGWLTPGVRGIGLASLLADLGHEVPTSLLPSFLSSVLGAPAAALGLIEGIADAISGGAKLAGGALADDPARRRAVAVGGYTVTALLSALIGVATAVWQVGLLRGGSWAARGIRGPARNALLADAVDPAAYGRAYGFERAMDNLGAVGGPVLAIVLVGLVGMRGAILLSVIPGLLAALAIIHAVRNLQRVTARERTPVRLRIRPLLQGRLGRLMVSLGAFEVGNMAATLLILRATELLGEGKDPASAAQLAIGLYTIYNLAATAASLPAGRIGDRWGFPPVLGGGFALFVLAYLLFAAAGPQVPLLGGGFAAAGVAIGLVETGEHAAVATHAPSDLRGSAFGLLAGVQSLGDLLASAVVGLLWTLAGPTIAFLYATGWMLVALVSLRWTGSSRGAPGARSSATEAG